MRRTIIILLLCLAVYSVSEHSAMCGSPYSANGIGTVIADDAGRSRGMGGVGIADTDGINLLRDNPALLTTFERFSFSFGANYGSISTDISNGESADYAKTDAEMLKIVIPLTSGLALGWGLTPYSKTDINIRIPGIQNGLDIVDNLSTIGGVNVSTASLAAAYKDFIHVGVSLNYNFGMIQEEWQRSFPNEADMRDSRYYLKRKFKGYSRSIGMLAKINETSSVGLAYTTQSDMKRTINVVEGDIINPDFTTAIKDMKLPASFRIGYFTAVRENLKAGLDFKYVQWEDAAVSPKEREMYTDSYRFGAGIRYIPSMRLNARYYETFPLSAGFRVGTLYYKSYPKIDTVLERAITFGVELPLTGGTGSIITSFELGTRGDKSKNGWEESFVSVGLSLVGLIK